MFVWASLARSLHASGDMQGMAPLKTPKGGVPAEGIWDSRAEQDSTSRSTFPSSICSGGFRGFPAPLEHSSRQGWGQELAAMLCQRCWLLALTQAGWVAGQGLRLNSTRWASAQGCHRGELRQELFHRPSCSSLGFSRGQFSLGRSAGNSDLLRAGEESAQQRGSPSLGSSAQLVRSLGRQRCGKNPRPKSQACVAWVDEICSPNIES